MVWFLSINFLVVLWNMLAAQALRIAEALAAKVCRHAVHGRRQFCWRSHGAAWTDLLGVALRAEDDTRYHHDHHQCRLWRQSEKALEPALQAKSMVELWVLATTARSA